MGYKFNPFTSNLDNVVNVHNKLGGLQGGTTDEYYHLTATEAGYIDQDVTSGSKPNFDGENFTGIPDGALDTDYVEVAGDTMTGLLTLSGAPTNDLHAATKKYVDDSAFLQLAGGTMSGNIVMGDGGTIGQSAGPLLTFDDTNNYLEITGGNVGIGTTSPTSLLSVGASSQFQVDTSGDIVKLKNLTYSWPTSHTTDGFLKDNGSGTLTWTTISGAGGVSGSGTAGYLPKWNTSSDLNNSAIFQSGSNVGIGTTAPGSKLTIADSSGGNSLLITGSSGNEIARLQVVSGAANRGEFLLKEGVSGNDLVKFTSQNSVDNYINNGGNVGIGTTSPSTGYKLDVAGFINTNQTVNQYTYPSINALQTAETLQDGSAYTGTESTMSTTYQAVQFTASAAHTMGDFTVRVKESTDITNTTSYIRGYIYADDGGSPGKPTGSPLATGNFIRYGTLTTSYQTLSLGTRYILTNGVKYWLVIEQSAAPTGGNIVLDSDVSSNMGATSTDGSTWTNTNARLRYAIRGRTYYSLYANSTNSYGVYGSSTNSVGIRGSSTSSYGIRGNSTNSYGVYGNSTNSYGVYGSSTNSYGVYGSSTNSVGIRGSSTNSVGVYGSSTSNYGIRGSSTTNRSGYFYRNNTSGTATTAVLDVVQDSATSETNTVLRVQGDGTGDLVNIFDAGTEVFTILDGGNVGIGTAEPNQKLTVAGHITPSSNNTYDIGTSSYKWDDIYATNGTIQTSDANTKDNVEDSDLGLDFIKALKPVKYKWKDYIQTIEEEQPKTDKDGNVIQHDGISETEIVEKQIERTFTRPHYGLIAQDIEQLMVDKGINDFAGFIKSERDDKSVSYGLRYHEFIAPIIKAIQEQQLQIDDLIKRVEKLESIIKKL